VAGLLVHAAPDGSGEVIFAPETRERLGAAAVAQANQLLSGGKLTLSKETRPIRGGFILKSGNVEVNGTFETLVRLQRAETAGAVAKQLFPEA
jgi:V/A-type H+-transporting ATPase subunit E